MQKTYENLKDNDIEIIVIAYLLKHPELLDTHFEHINPDLFSNIENLKIYKVLNDFHQSQKNITIETIKNYIPDIQSNTLKDLSSQIDQIVFSKDIFKSYLETLQELFIRRELFKITQNKNSESTTFNTSSNIKDIVLDLEKKLFDLSNFKKDNYEFKDFATVTKSSLKIVEKAFKKKGKYSGIVSGFEDLDNMLGGLQNSDLIILAGRPSMGKTALGTNIAFNVAKSFKEKIDEIGNKKIIDGGKVAFFSLEMSSEQLATRILAEQTRISGDKMRKAELSKDDFKKIAKATSDLEDLNLFIDDNPMLTIATLRARARRLQRLHGIDLIIIDYLQLMSSSNRSKNENRVQEISEITRGLKAIAKELNIPIIALSQLSRQVEQREDKRPQLSDLRESGTIEQDSDVVMFIFRESYYLERMEPIKKPEEIEEKYQERTSRWQELCEKAHNTAEIIIAKQRHGPIGTIKTHFDSNYTRFSDMNIKDYDNIIE